MDLSTGKLFSKGKAEVSAFHSWTSGISQALVGNHTVSTEQHDGAGSRRTHATHAAQHRVWPLRGAVAFFYVLCGEGLERRTHLDLFVGYPEVVLDHNTVIKKQVAPTN